MKKILGDGVAVSGELKISLEYVSGDTEVVFHDQNKIMLDAKRFTMSFLYQDGIVSDPIRTFKLGTGGTFDAAGLYPKPLGDNQSDLNNPTIIIPIIQVEPGPQGVSITYLIDLATADGNGMLISEAGMFKKSGKIFNAKNFPAIPKSSEFSIHFEWTILHG